MSVGPTGAPPGEGLGGAERSPWYSFAEKVRLAVESSAQSDPGSGTSGLEVEYNILDQDLRPVIAVGSGPEGRSFADFLHEELLPEWVRDRFQLEVFHWMTEATTRPHFSPRAAVAEARVLEACLVNALSRLELTHGERLVAMHGNIPFPLAPTTESIPRGWNLARRRYLARCVTQHGASLATAGIHTNHSLPEALVSWDYFHLPLRERRGVTLEGYRNEALIRLTRLLRPFCPLFMAVSAASPLAWEEVDGRAAVVLTDVDSQRLLTFPNPPELDVPGLYASHREYLRVSYELVRSGVRIGANNWTPVRARSGVEPVARNILATSEQLRELYRRGVYSLGEGGSLEEAERALTIENLCARVDLPMSRVEVRTDEGGESFDEAVAKVAVKELMVLRIYGDPSFGAGYAYDAEDLARARRNEEAAARDGLDAVVEHPFSGRQVSVREWLRSELETLAPIAEALGTAGDLEPLWRMATGGPNPAGTLRRWIADRLGGDGLAPSGAPIVPPDLVLEWAAERRRAIALDVARIARDETLVASAGTKLAPLLEGLEVSARDLPGLPVRLPERAEPVLVSPVGGRVGEVIELAARLVSMPSVTNCPQERLEEVERCGRFIAGFLREAGAEVRMFERGRYPAVLAGFPGSLLAPVTLGGHFDVVRPEPDDSQFRPRVDGDYLWGRGSADMKTVVATYLTWVRHRLRSGPPWPRVNLLLVGNEENGEGEPWGTPHVLADLAGSCGWAPELMVIGERTGERGDELFGSVCTSNRGVFRLRLEARGERGHTGTGGPSGDLLERLMEAKRHLGALFTRHLTTSSLDGWESSVRFPFLTLGEPGVYNITAGEGVLGVEVRPIPEDDVDALRDAVEMMCPELGLELEIEVWDAGVACPATNPHLTRLLAAVSEESGRRAAPGRKLAGTSARFAPGGNAVIWGQSGIGPHARDERHYLPSIGPYLRVLDRFAGA